MGRYPVHQQDRNQRAIVEMLEAFGFSVVSIGRPVDLAVGYRGITYLVEIKRPNAKLRPSQQKFFDTWHGASAVLRSIEDAARWVEYVQRHGCAVWPFGERDE